MSEKNVSCRLSLEVHEKLTKKLKSVVNGKRISVGDLMSAAIEIPDEVLKPFVAEVLRAKTRSKSEAVGLGMKVRSLSSEAQAKVQAIIDAEESE